MERDTIANIFGYFPRKLEILLTHFTSTLVLAVKGDWQKQIKQTKTLSFAQRCSGASLVFVRFHITLPHCPTAPAPADHHPASSWQTWLTVWLTVTRHKPISLSLSLCSMVFAHLFLLNIWESINPVFNYRFNWETTANIENQQTDNCIGPNYKTFRELTFQSV